MKSKTDVGLAIWDDGAKNEQGRGLLGATLNPDATTTAPRRR